MTVHASKVGVHTHTPPGLHPRRACVRCGIERQTKADTPLCSACQKVCEALGERERWEQR